MGSDRPSLFGQQYNVGEELVAKQLLDDVEQVGVVVVPPEVVPLAGAVGCGPNEPTEPRHEIHFMLLESKPAMNADHYYVIVIQVCWWINY